MGALCRKLLPILTLLACAPSALALPVPASAPNAGERTVRVRVAMSASEARVRGYDLRIAALGRAGEAGGRPAFTQDRITEWKIDCAADGTVTARQVPAKAAFPLQLHASKGALELSTPAGFLTLNARRYRDVVRVFPVPGKAACEVINETSLEKYLDGLVNSEFSASWSEESIAAQVIAARTYALYQVIQARAEGPTRHHDLESSDRDQVYDGSLKEDYRSSRAVDRTRGMVLTASNGSAPVIPIKAFYHSTCGGMTEAPEAVWGGKFEGFKHTVRCPYCVDSPRFHWDLTVGSGELKQLVLKGLATMAAKGERISEKLPGWPVNAPSALAGGSIVDLRPLNRNARGRVEALVMYWRLAGRKTPLALQLPATRFREWVGAGRIRSTLFDISRALTLSASRAPASADAAAAPANSEALFTLRGRGFGHGVGMCQWGAKKMGERGFKTSAILKQYYPDARVRKLW